MSASVAVLLLVSLPARAQLVSETKIDVSRLGPQPGEVVPDFRLQDAHGKVWTRDSIMGAKGAMLVFSRSVDWCPFCKTQAIELQSRFGELRAQGLGLAVITYDSPAIMADFSRRRGITFPLLSDPESQTIRAYGILNPTGAAGTRYEGIPFPGTFLIDRDGKVIKRFFEEAYQERNTVSTIMLASGNVKASNTAKRIETEHLEVMTYLSDEVVAPGSLFSIVFDVKPNPGIHIYAPGAKNYRIVGFRLDPNPLVTTRPLQYPASEIYHIKPLDERVPVFKRPFRLVQTMSIVTTAEIRATVTTVDATILSGSFEYQACDDRVCFTPRSVPLSYSIKLRPLDTDRATVPEKP